MSRKVFHRLFDIDALSQLGGERNRIDVGPNFRLGSRGSGLVITR